MVRSHTHGRSGQTLIGVVTTAALSSIVFAGIVAMQSNLTKSSGALTRKGDRADLTQFILSVFSDPNNCSCQLDGKVNTTLAGVLKVDTTANPIPDIDLGVLRSGCNFIGTANILAQAGYTLPGSPSLKVSSVKVTNIAATDSANQYSGVLQIKLTPPAGGSPISPIQVHVLFKIDPSTGVANSRRISQCLGGPPALGKQFWDQCVVRYPPVVRTTACGIVGTVTCNPGETAVSGGAIFGSNMNLQNSYPTLNATNQITGWAVSWYDSSPTGTACGINALPSGTTAPGTNPCFYPPSGGRCGGAFAVCCKSTP